MYKHLIPHKNESLHSSYSDFDFFRFQPRALARWRKIAPPHRKAVNQRAAADSRPPRRLKISRVITDRVYNNPRSVGIYTLSLAESIYVYYSDSPARAVFTTCRARWISLGKEEREQVSRVEKITRTRTCIMYEHSRSCRSFDGLMWLSFCRELGNYT